jgi:hypothetical protein
MAGSGCSTGDGDPIGPLAGAGRGERRAASQVETTRIGVPICTVGEMERRRIDALLADRGLAGSRTSAAASVRAGRVRIGRDGPRASKPGQLVPDDAELLVEEAPRYVSRGGIKPRPGGSPTACFAAARRG